MKQKLFIIVAMVLLMPIGTYGQTYKELWKQVEQAQDRDLPKTAISYLEKIETKGKTEKAYGQLMRSTLLHAKLMAEVAPDSLAPAVARLEQQEQQADNDLVLQAVYDAVLSKIYLQNHQLSEDWKMYSDNYCQKALSRPDLLAQTKAEAYDPFVIKEKNSAMFDDDLLSVVGIELNAWRQLADYYQKAGKRQAACYTSLRMLLAEREDVGTEAYAKSKFVKSLDSLIAVYGDLPDAGEIALERYAYMKSKTDATRAERAAWLQESIRRWGSWPRTNQLRNLWQELINPSYEAEVPAQVAEVGKQQTVSFPLLRHLQSLTMRVYRTKQKGDTELNPNNEEDYKSLKSELTELTELRRTLTFSGHEDYENFEDSILLDGLPAGVYMVEFQSQPDTRVSRSLYFVSGMRVIMQHQPDNTIRYVVVDATTGQPVSGSTLRLSFSNGWRKPKTYKKYTPDSKGEVIYRVEDNKQPNGAFAFTKTDCYCPESNSYGRYTYYERQYNQMHTNLFTDRSIYRPGQTVFVSAIVWKEVSELDNQAVANHQVRFELRDANSKLVSEQNAVTDRFGKCGVQFTLPQGQLNGRFTIRANGGSTSIRVEEYKRPTFQIEFAEYKESYQDGDTVRAEGKALSYAGVPVQDAKVKYTVRRKIAFWWMSYSWYWETGYIGSGEQNEVLYEGEAVTADDGTFKVNIPLTVPKCMKKRPMYYSFVVEADVTDVAGETHSGTMSLPLGTKPTALTCDVPQKVRSDQMPRVTFNRCNAAGQPIAGQVKYRLDGGKWQQCDANSPVSLSKGQLKSGQHRLEAECGDDKVDVKFVVFGLDDKKPALQTDDWFYASNSEFPRDGKPVVIQVGASDPDLHIVYSIYSGEELLESGSVKKNGELINRKFTYEEEYGNGLLLTYAWVKNGQCHIHQHTIRRPMPDKRLKMTWQTFRDRLTPGQQEEWQLKITKPDGTPADASLLAVLYDKSLDQIASHYWSFYPSSYLPQPSTSWQWTTWGSINASGYQSYQGLMVPCLQFSRFDSSVYPHYVYYSRRGMVGTYYTRALAKASAPMVMEDGAGNAVMAVAETSAVEAKEVHVAKDEVAAGAQDAKGEDGEEKQEEVQVRENLQETAFCYPTLQTDQDGQVVLKFTLPESLTTWRFMGISNTADMLYGYIGAEAVAKKDVMIQPNVPRFIRMGDEAELSARIFNTSDHAVSGQAKLILIDPETNNTVFEQQQSFTAESEKTASVTFPLNSSLFTLHSSLLICKVVATGEGFSDGEQHYLPILPNSEYVTKTVPFTQHEAGVKTVDLTKLFPVGTKQQKLTIEYTNNPAWLMVQSMATIGQPWEHSAIDQAASYYSNLLAKSLLDQSPQVKGVFEQWKREAATAGQTTLDSQLEKNQELKDIVLSETPWVRAADRESEQKQRLGDFFDENLINNRLDMAVEKLKKLQRADGSFSWYPEMPGSTMVTVTVEEMLTRLRVMTGEQKEVKQIADKAFDFIGKEMVDLVKEMKKREKKGIKPTFPSFTALRWLYICALDGRQLSKSVQNANDYLYKLLKKEIKRQTIYEKALTTIILSKHGDAKLAAQYVQSLKEWTVFTEEMGRYYDTPRAGYSWYDYKIPTEVAAIEAIQMVKPQDKQTVDEMRRWLLQEKRTQAWDTPINSVNAIYAFLNGQNSLETKGAPTVLAIDNTPVETSKATAGVGYVKTAISEPQGKTFTATKTSEGTSWGAVYAQFFQKTSDIEASQSGIKITREIRMANGQKLDANSLKVGDRIKIRLTIESERDLDFVQVVDRRAACMEPVRQLSGYRNGAYCSPKDNVTHYFYYGISKGKHVIETEYYIDRAGTYETGTCTVGCAYAPEYRATTPSMTLKVKK